MNNPESKVNYSNNAVSEQSDNISTANVNKHNDETRIIEFMHDLKEAIQNGQFQCYENQQSLQIKEEYNEQSMNVNENDSLPIGTGANQSLNAISNLINVNNLSNQTFNYIINWLKQQKNQIEENKVKYSLFHFYFLF
jgi:hypothetical protein